METAPLSSAAPAGHRSHCTAPGTPMAFELTVEIRSMPKSLIDSWHRTEPPGRDQDTPWWPGSVPFRRFGRLQRHGARHE